jgi:hexosaminidase
MRPRLTVEKAPAELRGLLAALEDGKAFGRTGPGRLALRFERAEPGRCEVRLAGRRALVRYGAPYLAGRALGTLLAGLVKPGEIHREATPFRTLGVMFDCSRNAVMTAEHIRNVWLPRLALLGYNLLMLYTEDTYELPAEPYFGYQRGAYTAKELRSIVAAAERLGIEVVPCIQTLGHLAQILKHDAYRQVKDTSSVLLVGEPKTYRLIEKMIAFWSGICRTRRIHIGMDETHDLGRGRYLDLHGYRHGFDLFNAHLARVVGICRRRGLKPMIWSDMYFRLGCRSGEYYDPKTVIPKRVVRKIPAAADLVYWDYYHDKEAFYLDWISRHRAMGKEPIMGSGIWTWNRYWHDHRLTEANAGACVRACYRAKLQEVVFTMWGDNGAFCDHDSAFAGMAYCADLAFGAKEPDPGRLERRFAAVCGGSYGAHRLAGDIHRGVEGFEPNLWADPFFETTARTWAKDRPAKIRKVAAGFRRLAAGLAPHAKDRAAGDLRHAQLLAAAFAARYALAAELLAAYRRRDRAGLKRARRMIRLAAAAARRVADSFREMWLRHNKPEGLETIQGRFGMLAERYREMDRRVGEFLAGKIDQLSELDQRCPPG